MLKVNKVHSGWESVGVYRFGSKLNNKRITASGEDANPAVNREGSSALSGTRCTFLLLVSASERNEGMED